MLLRMVGSWQRSSGPKQGGERIMEHYLEDMPVKWIRLKPDDRRPEPLWKRISGWEDDLSTSKIFKKGAVPPG